MKRKLLAVSFLTLFVVLTVFISGGSLFGDLAGAPSGCTGSPADKQSCTSCHSGTATSVTGWITSNIPAEGYVPGKTYTITATATLANIVRFGFEVSPQKTAGTEVGTLVVTNTTQTQIVGTKYITHKTAGTTGSGSKTWTFNWVAPVAGTGSFSFYGAFNCANNDGTDRGDKIFVSTLAVNECQYTPQISSASGGLTSCNGALQLTVANASTYLWSNGTTNSQLTAATSGTYAVTATDTVGCPGNASASVVISSLTITQSHTNIMCGVGTGSINLTPSGGVAPYTYHWYNGSTSQNIQNLTSGNYSATVTDAGGCGSVVSVDITTSSAPVVTASHSNTTCGLTNGSVNLSVSSGAPPYTFIWNNNATSQNLSNIQAGNYTATVTDANGCSTTSEVSVSQGPVLKISETQVNPSCGSNNGNIDVTVSTGTSPYTYSWNTGITTNIINDVAAGLYTVTVTDSDNCTISQSITLVNPNAPTATALATDETCSNSNGSIDVEVNGGTSPYSFKWSSGQTTQDIDSLAASTYYITITDANSCVKTDSSVVLNHPPPILSSNEINTTCGANNGSVALTVKGGAPPYIYNWNTGSTAQNIISLSAEQYSVTVTDANKCTATLNANVAATPPPILDAEHVNATCGLPNGSITISVSNGKSPYSYLWNNGITTQTLTRIDSGTYAVTVTDASGCTVKGSTNISGGRAMLLSETHSEPSCASNTGTIDITVNAGTPPYSYLWNNKSTASNLNNLGAGVYMVTVTDSSGCNASETIVLQNLNAPTVRTTSTDETCGKPNGEIDLIVVGGSSPYTFKWNSGQTTEDIDSLIAGTYDVTVTDSNSCVVIDSSIIRNRPAPTLNLIIANATCGESNGSIIVRVMGGAPPYTCDWNTGSTTLIVNNLAPAQYSVTVTDGIGCTARQTDSIVSLTPAAAIPQVSIVGNTAFVYNDTLFTGFKWFLNGRELFMDTVSFLIADQSGNYTVVVTDANGCTSESTASAIIGGIENAGGAAGVLTYPNPVNDVLYLSGINGDQNTIHIYSMEGKLQIELQEEPGSNIPVDVSSLPPGLYIVRIEDGNTIAAITKFIKI